MVFDLHTIWVYDDLDNLLVISHILSTTDEFKQA